jgi:hypothetical protein
LEHGQEKVLFSALVLVTVEREHDCLEKCVYFGQTDETAKGGDVAGFGLEEKEEVGVLLQLAVVGIVALCRVDLFERSFDFALLVMGTNTSEHDARAI